MFQPIQDVVRHIEKGYRMEPPDGCPKDIAALMSEAWAFKPEHRPTFLEMSIKLRKVDPGTPSPATPQPQTAANTLQL